MALEINAVTRVADLETATSLVRGFVTLYF